MCGALARLPPVLSQSRRFLQTVPGARSAVAPQAKVLGGRTEALFVDVGIQEVSWHELRCVDV